MSKYLIELLLSLNHSLIEFVFVNRGFSQQLLDSSLHVDRSIRLGPSAIPNLVATFVKTRLVQALRHGCTHSISARFIYSRRNVLRHVGPLCAWISRTRVDKGGEQVCSIGDMTTFMRKLLSVNGAAFLESNDDVELSRRGQAFDSSILFARFNHEDDLICYKTKLEQCSAWRGYPW